MEAPRTLVLSRCLDTSTHDPHNHPCRCGTDAPITFARVAQQVCLHTSTHDPSIHPHKCGTGVPITFARVAEQARLMRETAIGVRTACGENAIAPLPSMEITLQSDDRIVVFAEDMKVTRSRR